MKGTGDGTGIVTTHVLKLPGMAAGEVGLAGVDKPGATYRNVAIPPWQFIGVEVLWNFLRVFLGLLAVDGSGVVDLAPPGDAFRHLYTIAGISLVPTALALAQELYAYLSKVRASNV